VIKLQAPTLSCVHQYLAFKELIRLCITNVEFLYIWSWCCLFERYIEFVTRLTWRVPQVEQELLTLWVLGVLSLLQVFSNTNKGGHEYSRKTPISQELALDLQTIPEDRQSIIRLKMLYLDNFKTIPTWSIFYIVFTSTLTLLFWNKSE
jgi:hypothetical protein